MFKYYVFEGSLGYVRPDMPMLFSPLAGDRDHGGAFHFLESERNQMRPATPEDFAFFRVQLPPDFSEENFDVNNDSLQLPG